MIRGRTTARRKPGPWPRAVLLLAAVSSGAAFASTAPAAAEEPPVASPGLAVLTTLHAQGAQVYECRPGVDGRLAWHFREPVATLLDAGRTVGRHYAGPSWELAEGGPTLGGRVIARLAGAGAQDIPWLRLEVSERRGDGDSGRLAPVVAILRINTVGGTAEGACATPGTFRSVAYAADYVFLVRRPGADGGAR